MKQLFFLLVSLIIEMPTMFVISEVLARDIVVSNAGITVVNGTYIEQGSPYNGKPEFWLNNITADNAIYWDGSKWMMDGSYESSFLTYYKHTGDTELPPTTGWESYATNGDPPMPTLSGAGAPVELINFTASIEHSGISLIWSTESEVNAIGFIIDRTSANEADWRQIASYQTSNELDCKNNQIGNTNYSYTDSTAQPGNTYTYRLSDVDLQGYVTALKEVTVITTGVAQQNAVGLPERTELLAAFPNPFNPKTEIRYNLATDVVVNLSVYNIAGKEVQRIIVNEFKSAGVYQTIWDGQNIDGVNVPSGTYLIRLRAGDAMQTQKVVLIR